MNQDCLLGYPVKPENIKPILGTTIEYFEPTVGNVKVTNTAYDELRSGSFERYIIAGITRNAFENNQEPPLIDSQFIREGYRTANPPPPITFKEKVRQFLKYI
jgi:hypothetical protein